VAVDHQPDADYFACMAASAGGHWWYVARRNLVADALGGRLDPGTTALDVGTGTGEFCDTLRSLGATTVVGTELNADAAVTAAGARRPVVRALAERLPLPDATVQVLTSLDVVEHLDDDLAALEEYHRVCAPGARVVITVPAYMSLWSHHDERAAHRRRYRRQQLCDVLGAAGFTVERATYTFSFLVPPAWLVRRTPLGRVLPDTDEEASSGGLLDRVLAALARLERRWLRRRTLPVGLSILVVARA
jgi:SAM-dependent methyltransferase